MNYMIKGIQALKESFFLGIIIYIVIFVLLYLFKKRRTISWNYMFEGIFCIYCVTLLNLTGIFTLSYSLNGPFNYNLLPFIGSSIVPILLNFALFFPLGFLLPLIFRSSQWGQVKWLFYCPAGSPNRLNRISHIISIFKNTLILNQSSIHYVCCIYLSCNPVLFQMLYKTIQITKRSFNNVLTQTS